MGLHFVLGPSGSGKTTELFETVIKLARENPHTMYYYIVPEQFSLQTQHDLLKVHPNKGILNIDVTSMSRLANAAFAKLSGIKHEFIPEIGKSMIIKKVLNDNEDKLTVYRRYTRQAGFVAEVKAMLSELWNYNVTEDDLLDVIKQSSKTPVLQRKLNDALVVLSGVNEFLGSEYLTNEGMYDAFAAILEKSGLMHDAVVVLDGFTGFTPSEDGILKEFLRLAKDVYISFTIDKDSVTGVLQEYEVFHMTRESMEKVSRLADEVGCDLCPNVCTDFDKYGDNRAIAAIRDHLFRKTKDKVHGKDIVTVYAASSIEEEAKTAAAEIERLVRVKGYHYSDIAVLCSDIEGYGESVSKELDKIKARYFLDRKKTLRENECAAFIHIVLSLMEKDADIGLYISYAKNSLSGIDFHDACLLENYCIALGIKGSRLKKPFTKEMYGKQMIDLAQVNSIREALMEELSGMLSVKTDTAKNLSKRLVDFLTKTEIEKKLSAIADEFGDNDDDLKAKEYSKVYGAVISTIDQMVLFLGDVMMDAKEYREIIEAGLSEAKVGLVPKGSDNIVIGDVERTRLSNIKALFVLGANENKFPKPSVTRGLFADKDKQELLAKGIELSPARLKKTGNDRFYVYLALTKPTEMLWISYASTDDGGELKPSTVVNELMRLYDDVIPVRKDDLSFTVKVLENDLGKTERLRIGREKNIRNIGSGMTEYENIGSNNATALYGDRLRSSISKFETYASCPFRYFLQYGLSVYEKDEYSLSGLDFGNVSHIALEKYGEALKRSGLDWTEVSDDMRNSLIADCSNAALSDMHGGIFEDSEKNRGIAKRIEEALAVTVDMLTGQIKESDFRPIRFEDKFVEELRNFTLEGKIDRIDVCDTNVLNAVKVVDYKSSQKSLDLNDLYYGLSMQLPTYLRIASKKMNNATPAAMLYNEVDDPIIDADKTWITGDKADSAETLAIIRDKIAGEFKPGGYVTKDNTVIKSLDHGFIREDNGEGLRNYTSKKIPVNTKKPNDKGEVEFGENSKLLTGRQMKKVLEYSVELMNKQASEIMQGNAAVMPACRKDVRACKYCAYSYVCGFDPANGGKQRNIAEHKEKDALTLITGEEE